jgi:FtsP/CotA-like multicopper oxidase with cupredoxin domain
MNNRKVPRVNWTMLSCLVVLALVPACAVAQTPAAPGGSPTPVPPVANPCPRFTAGSVVQNPPALFSSNGVLNVQFSYQTKVDGIGRQVFCFMTPNGLENPTLHVNPGDTLNITVTNNTPTNPVGVTTTEKFQPPNCGDTTFSKTIQTNSPPNLSMTGGSMNIHYHGTNTSPACHGDNVVKTLINAGNTFQYSLQFPSDEPPGLYWYHPHVHGLAEAAVFGGAAGALVVDGIENAQPAVAELRNQIIVIRDQPTLQGLTETPQTPAPPGVDGGIPQHDLTVNFVPLDTFTNPSNNVTSYTPAVIHMASGEKQFWRVCNCTSDAPLDLQVRFDGAPQTIQLVGIDAVPVNSQEGPQPPQLISETNFRLPPASRVEFIVDAPPSTVKLAQLVAQFIYPGPLGDNIPTRPLLTMKTSGDDGVEPQVANSDHRVPAFRRLASQQRFSGISDVTPSVTRTVFFEEVEDGSFFFINASGCVTAAGARCPTQPYKTDTIFDNNNAPAIITTQGSVEKWIIQNHARENHELHQHQIHFKVMSQENFEVNGSKQAPGIDRQFLDMVEIPFCGGAAAGVDPITGAATNPPNPPACVDANGNPSPAYPQVTALMDFRGPDIGDFVFHCHILGHEDLGMMAIERVKPKDE